MVNRRLDAADRAALRPGCVYVWEERSPASDATGTGMERFTEGRHWHPSRVRDVSLSSSSVTPLSYGRGSLLLQFCFLLISLEGLPSLC